MKLVLEIPGRLAPLAAFALVLVAVGSGARASEERPPIEPLASPWVQTGHPPISFLGNPAFYEPTTDVVRVFGAADYVYLPSDTWTTQSFTQGADASVFVADPLGRRYLGLSIASIWTLPRGGDEWSILPVDGPHPQAIHQAVFDSPRNRVLAFDQTSDLMWQLTLDGTPTWSPISAVPDFSGYCFYDPIGDRLLVVSLTTLWSAPLSDPLPTWTSQPIGGTAPRVYGHMVFDVRGYRILDWGGGFLDCTFPPCYMNYQTSTRTLDLSTTPIWGQITTTATPSVQGRVGHTMAHDFVRNRLVMSGGYWHSNLSGDHPLFDTWTLNIEGGGAANLALDPAVVDFGAVPGPGVFQQTLEFSNVGSAPAAIFAIVSNSPNVTVSPRAFGMNPNFSRTVTIEWNGADAVLDATLEIESSDPWAPLRSVRVTGSSPTVDVGAANLRAFGLSLSGGNPTAGPARLELTMPAGGAVEVTVHDLRGSSIRTLVDGVREAGRMPIAWDGRDDGGRRVGAGVYFVRARTGAATARAKVVVTR